MLKKTFLLLSLVVFNYSCSTNNEPVDKNTDPPIETSVPQETETTTTQTNFNLLALGDSYTIGQGVCATCSYPEQLKVALKTELGSDKVFDLKVVAQTGWPTTSLLRALSEERINTNYDLVSLLIGVNNQFQGNSFSVFEREFSELVSKSTAYAKGDKSNIVIISIPDYSFTPVGSNYANVTNITTEIDTYNNFIKTYCRDNNIAFIDITDISRTGITNPALVADDGLHLSKLAYERFVNRLLPVALQKLTD